MAGIRSPSLRQPILSLHLRYPAGLDRRRSDPHPAAPPPRVHARGRGGGVESGIEEPLQKGHWESDGRWNSLTPCPLCRGHLRAEDKSECLSCGQMLPTDAQLTGADRFARLAECSQALRDLQPEDSDTSRFDALASEYSAAGVSLDGHTIRRLGETKRSPIGFVLSALRDELDAAGGDHQRAWAAIEARTKPQSTGRFAGCYHKEIGRYS